MPFPLPADLAAQVTRALQEDIGSGDLTANLIPANTSARATILTREPAVLCGRPWVDEVFRQLSSAVRLQWQAQDGETLQANQTFCTLEGPARALLSGERAALNFLQTLSATATATHRFVAAIAGTGCTLLDTRKTLPGLRTAQKYATLCGGGSNHRIGLYDAVLIKENHIAAAGSIASAVAAARARTKDQVEVKIKVEVEVETLEELRQALSARPDMILLDDFPLDDLKTAVRLNAEHGKTIELEASGGISLANIRAIAETGVDYISTGSTTKHIQAIDLSMRIV